MNNDSTNDSLMDNFIGLICFLTFMFSIGIIGKYTDEKPRKPNNAEGRIYPCVGDYRIVLYLNSGEKRVLEVAKSVRWGVIILGMTYSVIKKQWSKRQVRLSDK